MSSPIQVFSSHESSEEEPLQPFLQLSRGKGGHRLHKGPWPALKSRQSVVALQSAALVASRARAFQEQEQGEGQEQGQGEASMSSTPRIRKMVRQASVDDSREEGEA
jgi:protein phosphatase slingshot